MPPETKWVILFHQAVMFRSYKAGQRLANETVGIFQKCLGKFQRAMKIQSVSQPVHRCGRKNPTYKLK